MEVKNLKIFNEEEKGLHLLIDPVYPVHSYD